MLKLHATYEIKKVVYKYNTEECYGIMDSQLLRLFISQYAPIKHLSCQKFLAGNMANVQMMNDESGEADCSVTCCSSNLDCGMGIKSNTVVYMGAIIYLAFRMTVQCSRKLRSC